MHSTEAEDMVIFWKGVVFERSIALLCNWRTMEELTYWGIFKKLLWKWSAAVLLSGYSSAKCTFSWIRNICVGSLCRTPNWSSRCHICALGSLTIGRKLHSGDRCCWTVEDIVFWPLYARRMLHWQNVWSCMEINGWWLWILAFNMLKNINSE